MESEPFAGDWFEEQPDIGLLDYSFGYDETCFGLHQIQGVNQHQTAHHQVTGGVITEPAYDPLIHDYEPIIHHNRSQTTTTTTYSQHNYHQQFRNQQQQQLQLLQHNNENESVNEARFESPQSPCAGSLSPDDCLSSSSRSSRAPLEHSSPTPSIVYDNYSSSSCCNGDKKLRHREVEKNRHRQLQAMVRQLSERTPGKRDKETQVQIMKRAARYCIYLRELDKMCSSNKSGPSSPASLASTSTSISTVSSSTASSSAAAVPNLHLSASILSKIYLNACEFVNDSYARK